MHFPLSSKDSNHLNNIRIIRYSNTNCKSNAVAGKISSIIPMSFANRFKIRPEKYKVK